MESRKKGLTDFCPEKVKLKDRFSFNICRSGINRDSFIRTVVSMRCCVGNNIELVPFIHKWICVDSLECEFDRFLILKVGVNMEYVIECVIFKPEIYMLAVGIDGEWWSVSDFTAHTTMTFSRSKKLAYDSAYKTIPSRFNCEILCDAVMSLFKGNSNAMVGTNDHYLTLVTTFCESMRYDIVLYPIANSLNADFNATLGLCDEQLWCIKNWEVSSMVGIFIYMGYRLDPLERGVAITKLDDFVGALGLLLAPDHEIFVDQFLGLLELEKKEKKEEKKSKKDSTIPSLSKLRIRKVVSRDIKFVEDIRLKALKMKTVDRRLFVKLLGKLETYDQ